MDDDDEEDDDCCLCRSGGGHNALWGHKKNKNGRASSWEERTVRIVELSPWQRTKMYSPEKVAIVENFRIMNLWSVCLIDKSLYNISWLARNIASVRILVR